MKNKLMTHVVAGYPTEAACIELLLSMQKTGVAAIEVQIPFSDPAADGMAIMEACDVALADGMTISRCFAMIRLAQERGLTVPVYIMSYANKLFYFGFEAFCQAAQKCSIAGLIVPDLPFDTPEYEELLSHCKMYSLNLVPVLSPGIPPKRLAVYTSVNHTLMYVTSTRGITGQELRVHPDLLQLAQTIRARCDCQIALGFGIRSVQDVQKALEIADMAVIGSEVVRVIKKQGIAVTAEFIKGLVHTENGQ